MNKRTIEILTGLSLLVAVILVVLLFTVSGNNKPTPTTTTTNLNAQWATWRGNVLPVMNQAQADYTQTFSALSNNDTASAIKYFANLSSDAANLSKVGDSPDPVVNADVQTLASAIQTLASDGLNTLNGNTSLTTFQADVEAYSKACTALANQITADTVKY